MTSLCIAYVTLLWLKLSIACIISYDIRVKHNKQIHMFSDFLHCEVYTCGWCYYLWFSKNSHACEEFGDCVAQKNCSTKQIAVQSHGSCFIYLGCQLTHKDCWFIEYNQGIKTNSWSVNWEVYEKSGYLLRIQYGYGQSMVNRHKSSLSGHVNLFFLAIIVANYTYTNGPLSMHLNVHSMFIHFQCRLAQPPTHLARFLVSIAGNRRFLRFTSAPNGAESGSPRRREKGAVRRRGWLVLGVLGRYDVVFFGKRSTAAGSIAEWCEGAPYRGELSWNTVPGVTFVYGLLRYII